MSEPENKPPPKESERESVFKVLDELVSHMYTFRNVSMLLIISAFVLVPISLVIAVLLLSAPAFVPGPEVNFVVVRMTNGTLGPISVGKLNASYMPNEVFIQKGVNMTAGTIVTTHVGPPDVMYFPAGSPRFMISGGPLMHQVLDISTVIIVFIIVSIVLSSIYLFIGIKEYSFFSRWNKKFSRYMSLRDKVDRELGEEKK